MTESTTPVLALLRDAEHYLSAVHGSVARHDNLGVNLGCAGCALRDRLAAARSELAAAEESTTAPLLPADQAAELEKLVRWHREDGKALDEMRATIQRLRAERDELRRMADGTADTQPRVVDRPTLAAALDDLHTLIATSSRDWQTYRVDAWLWAVLCGWDCEQAEHDDTCTHGALEETAAMHGWDDATVAKARRYRAAVRALTAIADAAQQGDETAGTETEAHAPFCQWRVETLDGDEWMPASGLRRDRAQAAAQFRMASERRPLWSDGTPVRRRLVRETTTYTVEQPAVEARKDGAER